MSIFSRYSQGENRVTSTILKVMEALNHKVTALILQYLMGDASIQLMNFYNQPSLKNTRSVPDGQIMGLFNYYIETKSEKGAVDKDQIEKHLEGYINKMPETINSALLCLTPDEEEPDDIKDFEKVHWANFDTLIGAIDSILEGVDIDYILTDREIYLLNELKHFIQDEGLLSDKEYEERVLIVANKDHWWRLYEDHSVYICQPDRHFRKSAYMAFTMQTESEVQYPPFLAILTR